MPSPQPKYYNNWATRSIYYYYYFHGLAALVALGLLIVEVPQSHSDTPHSVRILWTSDRPVAGVSPNNTHPSQQTNIHAPGRIQTRNPSKRAAVDPRLRSDRQSQIMPLNTEQVWSNNTARPVAVWGRQPWNVTIAKPTRYQLDMPV
jgi:hypothetical protein